MLRLFIWMPPESGGPSLGTSSAPRIWYRPLATRPDALTAVTEKSIPIFRTGLARPTARRLRAAAPPTPDLRDEPVAVAAVGRARVLDDVARRPTGSRARRGAPASGAGRRAPPTPPRSSPSARPSACRRRSRCRSGSRAARRTSSPRGPAPVRPGTSDARDVQELDRHRVAVGEAEPLDRDDRPPTARRAGCVRGARRPGSRAGRACGSPALRPRARMSSLNDVMSMPFATFGSRRTCRRRGGGRGSPRGRARRAPRAR